MLKGKKLWFTAIVFLLILAAACSSETGQSDEQRNESANNGGEQVSLRILHNSTGEQPGAIVIEPGLEKFMDDNPNIDLEINTSAGNSIREVLLAEMAGNNPPDVFFHWGLRRTENYIENGKIADLTELIAEDPDLEGLYADNAFNPVTYKDGVYGLPLLSYMYYMMINTEMFEEHSVEVPTTYDELVVAVEQFRDAGLIPFAANNHSARYMMLTWLSQRNTMDSIIPYVTGDEPFGDDLLDAATKAQELEMLGAFPDGKETIDTLQSLELFNAERAPMYYQHSWTFGSVDPEMYDKIEIIPFPLADEDATPTVIEGSGFFVYMSQQAYEDPEKREAAWELVKYLAGPEIARDHIEMVPDLTPVIVDYDESKVENPIFNAAMEMRDNAQNTVPSLDEDLFSQGVQDNYWTITDRLSLQEITPEEYVEEMNELVQQYPNEQYE